MRFWLYRPLTFALLLGAIILTMSKTLLPTPQFAIKAQTAGRSSKHDFDFLVGSWAVEHRRLKHRLAHSNEWETFPGICKSWLLLEGQGDVDDNVLQLPTGIYHAVTLRSFDPATKSWSIWWLDSRHPHKLDPPVIGEFRNGTGTFFAQDTFDGRPIVVRYIWSDITANSAKWQQAFSDDGGKTWETNWIMEFRRLAPGQSRWVLPR
jgi:hypothetical protein